MDEAQFAEVNALLQSDDDERIKFFRFTEQDLLVDPPIADLPDFPVVNLIPNRNIHGIGGEEFMDFVDSTYTTILSWRKNLFKLPNGNASKRFVTTLTEWIEHFNLDIDMKGIALKVFLILPAALLLQKPSKTVRQRIT